MRRIGFLASMQEKLESSSGETMVETLVSVLISALALMLLSTAIGSSVNIVLSSREHMEERYNYESAMVSGSPMAGSPKKITVDVPLKAPVVGTDSSVPVDVYGSDKVDLYLYRRSS